MKAIDYSYNCTIHSYLLIVAILIAYIYLISLKLRSRNFKRKNNKWKEENRKSLYEFIMHNKCHDFKIEHTADIHALESLH